MRIADQFNIVLLLSIFAVSHHLASEITVHGNETGGGGKKQNLDVSREILNSTKDIVEGRLSDNLKDRHTHHVSSRAGWVKASAMLAQYEEGRDILPALFGALRLVGNKGQEVLIIEWLDEEAVERQIYLYGDRGDIVARLSVEPKLPGIENQQFHPDTPTMVRSVMILLDDAEADSDAEGDYRIKVPLGVTIAGVSMESGWSYTPVRWVQERRSRKTNSK